MLLVVFVIFHCINCPCYAKNTEYEHSIIPEDKEKLKLRLKPKEKHTFLKTGTLRALKDLINKFI